MPRLKYRFGTQLTFFKGRTHYLDPFQLAGTAADQSHEADHQGDWPVALFATRATLSFRRPGNVYARDDSSKRNIESWPGVVTHVSIALRIYTYREKFLAGYQ